MATMTHRTTFALDETTAQRLRQLAKRWNVSQAEVVRRAVGLAEKNDATRPDIEEKIHSARQLRESLRTRITPEEWIDMIQEARR